MDAGFGWNGIASRAHHCRGLFRFVLLLLLPALVAGCLQMERIVQVKGDGSGVLIERMVLSNEFVGMMAGVQPEGQPLEIRDDSKLRAGAASFGDSVRFVSARDLVTDFGRGYEARYAFDDINRIRVGQDIDDSVPGGPGASDDSGGEEPKFTTFTLRRTNPVGLVIHWPVDEAGANPAAEDSTAEHPDAASATEQEQMAMEMMKTALEGMRIAMHVEIMGDIVATNATHIEGTRVTLMEIDFGAFLSNEAALQALAGKKLGSVADLKELMKLIPGLKLEIEPKVAILFH
jgi:hypothetical protein